MSTEYAQPGLKSGVDRSGYPLAGANPEGRSPGKIAPLPVKVAAPAPDPEEPSRFQGGTLTQVVEQNDSGDKGSLWRAGRRGPLGWLDRGLLVAEIVCALVVAWLVAQYIYTVYFDTAPHRPVPTRTTAGAVSQAEATRTPMPPTPTIVTRRVPSPAPGELDGVTDPAQMMGIAATPEAAQGSANVLPATTATPEPTVDPALLLPKRLRIPVMFLDSPVHEVHINMGTWEVSPMDIGHHEGTGAPGQVGNVVLAGHRDINSALFRELDRLKPGDSVFVSNSFREYRYIVNDSFVVGPYHTEVMDPTGDKRVTLITCTPIGLDTQRLIVTATLDESYEAENR